MVAVSFKNRQHEIESEPPPLFEGLSVEGRRAVNLAVIAYAEALHERIAAAGLADLVRQSTLRRVYESSYGGREDCLALMHRAGRLILSSFYYGFSTDVLYFRFDLDAVATESIKEMDFEVLFPRKNKKIQGEMSLWI